MKQITEFKGALRIVSEPGDMTRYDYIIIKDFDDYIFAPYKSTFSFPQRLNYYSIEHVYTLEDCIQFIKDRSELKHVNPNTLFECIKTIKEIHNK